MKKFMCDGEGVEVGVQCVVRERTKLSDADIYSGTIVAIERMGDKPNPYDEVYVMNDTGVYVTHRHCVYATEENLRELLTEVKDARESMEGFCEKERIANAARMKSIDSQMPNMRDNGTFPSISLDMAKTLTTLTEYVDNSFNKTEELDRNIQYMSGVEFSISDILDKGLYYIPQEEPKKCCKKCKNHSDNKPIGTVYTKTVIHSTVDVPENRKANPVITFTAVDPTDSVQITLTVDKSNSKSVYQYLKDNNYKKITITNND